MAYQKANGAIRLLLDVRAMVDGTLFLMGVATTEIATVERERDRLEIYDEPEAAALLRIEAGLLGDMRRRYKFPHCKFGTKVRYTRQHLNAIIEYFEIREQKKKPK